MTGRPVSFELYPVFIRFLSRHEHLYEKIERNVIESSDFPRDLVATQRLLLGARVILCTLSMITNGRLGHFTQLVPVERVIVDEASQIEVGQYLPLFSRFRTTLKKIVFIGDDKQCEFVFLSFEFLKFIVFLKCHHMDRKTLKIFRVFLKFHTSENRSSFLILSVSILHISTFFTFSFLNAFQTACPHKSGI